MPLKIFFGARMKQSSGATALSAFRCPGPFKGRTPSADLHTELGLVGAATARRLFERFFPSERDLASVFEQRLGGQKHSPAQIQGWLLANSTDAYSAAQASGLEGHIQDIAAE
ncbi:hypothetical protein C8N32_1441 [Rhodovulum imhoffii]|uniref:Mitochondrial chaperone BCS1-like ATPase lid domain-containing protein n=1 Tax=Rhodovulum imhoffii TaxID=365340 RepID=A0A2T5BL95_9RHOB|nr:hypothetical protein [Rhodovulum imhoffii]PTM99673.1 hypothetical protein C8N32_1441 [Rhodovulum imhoffii]